MMLYRKKYYLRHPLKCWMHCVVMPLRKFWQRGRHGWSEQDAWSFDTYLAQVISEGCEHLRSAQSYPGDLTPEAWDAILAEIVAGFAPYVHGKFTWDDDDPEHARFNESMGLLVEWWGNLWD